MNETNEIVSLHLRRDKIATMPAQNFDIIKAIRAIDGGNDVIYLTDANGVYIGKCVTKTNFFRIWYNANDAVVSVPALQQSALERNNWQDSQAVIRDIWLKHPETGEIPVLDQEGRVFMVLAKDTSEPAHLSWHTMGLWTPYELFGYKKIYLSSVEHPDLLAFYRRYNGTRLNLHPLTAENIKDAVENKENLIIYAEDIFPNCTKKSIKEVYDIFLHFLEQEGLHSVFFSNDWASIKTYETNNKMRLLEKFDQGYQTVVVENDNGNWQGEILLHVFAQNFPGNAVPVAKGLEIAPPPPQISATIR